MVYEAFMLGRREREANGGVKAETLKYRKAESRVSASEHSWSTKHSCLEGENGRQMEG
jgi:hypothetical protein